MQIDVRRRGSVQVLDVRGEASGPGEQGVLSERILRLLDGGEYLFILNLVQAAPFESMTLGASWPAGSA